MPTDLQHAGPVNLDLDLASSISLLFLLRFHSKIDVQVITFTFRLVRCLLLP